MATVINPTMKERLTEALRKPIKVEAEVQQKPAARSNNPTALRTPQEEQIIQDASPAEQEWSAITGKWKSHMEYAKECARFIIGHIRDGQEKHGIMFAMGLLRDQKVIQGWIRQYQVHTSFHEMCWELVKGTMIRQWKQETADE